jgi:membrane associated rhomboid family serine protease
MTPWVRNLLFANVAVFFMQMTMPGVTNALVFVPALVLVRPWSLVTYMFLHGGIMHIAFNMIALYFFGPQVEARLGSRSFVQLYFVSGVSGAVLSMFLAFGSPIIGASAAVFGVMLAFAWFWPDAQILIWGILPVSARVLVIATTILSLMSGLGGSRGGIADFAHLGGYAGAFVYLRLMSGRAVAAKRSWKRRVSAAPPPNVLRNWKSIDTRSVHEVNRDEVNRILDKINAHGVDALTNDERTFLSNFVPKDEPPPVS